MVFIKSPLASIQKDFKPAEYVTSAPISVNLHRNCNRATLHRHAVASGKHFDHFAILAGLVAGGRW